MELKILHQSFTAQHGGIHFCDEHKRGDGIALQQVPQCFRVGLYPVRPADHQHRCIEYLQRAFRLSRKINMPRGIEQCDLQVIPLQHCLLGENCDTPLAFLVISIQKAVPMIYPAEGSYPAG